MAYDIEYREVEGGTDWRTEPIYRANILELIIADLVLFKTYEIRIRAINTFGKSDWSPAVVIYLEMGKCCADQHGAWAIALTNPTLIYLFAGLYRLSDGFQHVCFSVSKN